MNCSLCCRPLASHNRSGICNRCQIKPKRSRPYRENQQTEEEIEAMIAERLATMPGALGQRVKDEPPAVKRGRGWRT